MELLSLKDAAAIARKTPNTLLVAIRKDKLAGTRMGRDWFVTRADLDKWLADPAMHRPGVKKGR